MKIILLILIYHYSNNIYIFENQNINISYSTHSFIINNWSQDNIQIFQIGFYIELQTYINEFTLISLTDYKGFNYDIKIKTNQYKIYLNNLDTSLSLLNYSYFYLKGQLNNKNLSLNLKVNDITNSYSFLNNSYNLENFNNISIILGSDKDLFNFKFIGKILYLSSIVNDYTDRFDNLKNIYSKILVYHNFKYNIKDSNYFYNVINNGFIGSINGANLEFNKNRIFVHENILPNNNIIINTFFKPINSYINLSTDFIKYTSLFPKKAYSVYLSLRLKINYFVNNNLINFNFAFYKRNNLEFINNITRLNSSNSLDYKINSSFNTFLKSGSSDKITHFKMILIKIMNINNNNYKITYIYETNKTNFNDFYKINIEKNENHVLLNNDKHYIGVINTNNLLYYDIRIYIYEIALMIGTSFYEKNQNLYTKIENNDFVWYCNKSTLIKNRTVNYNTCENDDFMINNPINGCLLYKNSICYKCISTKKLNNNSCIDKINTTFNFEEEYLTNLKLFKNIKSNLQLKNHEFSLDFGNMYKKYIFDCNIRIFNERYIILDIKLNNNIFKLYNINQSNIVNNIHSVFDFYLKGINKISIYKIDNVKNYTTYECNIYSSDFNISSKSLIPFEKCDYLINNNYLLKITEFMLFECFNKNNAMNNYYSNTDYNIIIKCNKNCKKCNSAYECIECIDNYFLLDNICLQNKNKNCLIPKDHSKCLKCTNNSKKFELNNNLFNCFSNCYLGCNNCDSPLYNECLSCNTDYLYYPGLKQCLFSGSINNCNNNYKKITLGINMCISNCKLKNNENECISCYKLLNLNKSLNECINCNIQMGYFKNLNILDSENRETCEKCNDNCKTCEFNKDKCTSCYNSKLLMINLLKCVDSCPISYYKYSKKCIKCNNFCLICDINNENCLSCSNNKFIKYNKCVDDCGKGYFLKEKKCIKCPEKCEICENYEKCTICKNEFYLDIKYNCIKCNLINNIIIKNNCFLCSNNCKTCTKNIHNCNSCHNNYSLNKLNNNCLKKCNLNEFFDIKLNICKSCKLCNACSENSIGKCVSCEICNKKCKINIILKNDYIQINSLENTKVLYNNNYNINSLIKDIILIENGIQFYFKNKYPKNSINLLLNNNLFIKTINCFNLNNYEYIIFKEKEPCVWKFAKINNSSNKLIYNISTNFIFNKNFEFDIVIKEINRIIYYKILKISISNNMTNIEIELLPNYFKTTFSFIFILFEKNINNSSNCKVLNIKETILVSYYKTEKFKTDYEINKDIILKGKDLKIIENIDKVSVQFQNTTKNSSIILILINIFNSGNIILFLSIIQLVYIFEFIILWPVNLGDITNNFIYYFKLDIDLEININNLLNFKNNKEISKFYENKFINNPKISNIRWINITFVEIDILIIFSLNIIRYIIEFLKVFFKKSIFLDKLILNIRVLIFKFIETFKPIIMAIIIVYFININNFHMNFDNIKVVFIIFTYYLIFNSYLWDLLSSIMMIGGMKDWLNKNQIKYYKEILLFKSGSIDKYSLYQLFYLIKEFFFVIIIFILRSIKIHAFLFFIIQLLFVIYVLTLDEQKSYFKIQKIKFEEIINWILIWSIILIHYFKLEQFQLCFIIFYVLILGVNLLIWLFNMIKNFYNFTKDILNKKKKLKNN